MEVLRQLPELPAAQPAAVAFGNFDGVHLGHQALLTAVRQAADALGGPATVVTFDPHPLQLLRPDTAPSAVDALDTRLALLRSQGIDRTLVLTFDHALAAQTADWFARVVLVERLGARHLVTGPDVRFGHGGHGGLALLRDVLGAIGGQVQTFDGVQLDGAAVSSSRVRAAVQAGEVTLAARLLGRPFCLRGEVVHGDARGRTIGFPTANLAKGPQVLPALGVYACLARIDGAPQLAVTHVGQRPTFAGTDVRVEAHLLDGLDHQLYGKIMELDVIAPLRGEQRFADLEALQQQIRIDVGRAREVLTTWLAEARTP